MDSVAGTSEAANLALEALKFLGHEVLRDGREYLACWTGRRVFGIAVMAFGLGYCLGVRIRGRTKKDEVIWRGRILSPRS